MSASSLDAPSVTGSQGVLTGATERRKLRRSLGRLDLIFFTICAVVSLDTIGEIASFGRRGFTWMAIMALGFAVPYALIMAEMGSAFPQEGGPYEWMRRAWGNLVGGVGGVLYWAANPLWIGGSLSFLAASAWSSHIHPIGTTFTVGNVLFKLAFIWLAVGVAITSLRYGKWVANIGSMLRLALLGFFTLTVIIYAAKHGVHGAAAGVAAPKITDVWVIVPIVVFTLLGFDAPTNAGEEMKDPQRDVPFAAMRSVVICILGYGIPIYGIIAVLPASKVSGISGFLDAVGQTFTVYGSAGHFLSQVMAILFILALVAGGSVWLIASDRALAVSSYSGTFPRFFGQFSDRLGTPVRVNILSGIVATGFMLVAVALLSGSASAASQFTVVIYLATSTSIFSYLLVFPTLVRLRTVAPDVQRPFRVPGGVKGAWAVVVLTEMFALIGVWTSVFPSTLPKLFGYSYSFQSSYGVSAGTFEGLTLGALAAVILIGVIGYVIGQREQKTTRPGPGLREGEQLA
jgi:amino acid transporter